VNILIAPDKFKGSLSASEVCDAVSEALLEMNASIQITKVPLADGGEGTFEILVAQSKGRIKKVTVVDPLQRPITAEYGLSKDGTSAFIEMAKSSGLQLLKEKERNPLYTTTAGTGQLIADALNEGVTNIILGIGGSATNDAGIGMAHALGYRFLDRENHPLSPIGKSLSQIHSIDETQVDSRLRKVEFKVLCDVTNPLYGPQGAAPVYGPQKGASDFIVKELDAGLKHLAELVKQDYAINLNFPGAGAAGGLGAGAKLFLNATLQKGIDYISQVTDLEKKVSASDLVITGEGRVDQQSLSGKVVAHVYRLAKKYNKEVVILCGQCTLSKDDRLVFGSDKIIPLANNPSEVSLSMKQPVPLIKSTIQLALADLL
jgi:glycerate kinase